MIRDGHRASADDLESDYRFHLEALLENPTYVTSPRGQKTYEDRNVVLRVADPTDCLLVGIGRGLSVPLAVVEALQLIGGFSDPDTTVAVAPNYASYMNDDRFHGAYGSRTGIYMGDALKRLRDDPDSRQANVTLWENELDLRIPNRKDIPCTVYFNFAVREGKLLMTTHMRSNDLWLGWPYDVFQFTCLARTVANHLKLEAGHYVHVVNSLHLYERNEKAARELLASPPTANAEQRRVTGGIGQPGMPWELIQERARIIFDGIEPDDATSEETWLASVMKKVHQR